MFKEKKIASVKNMEELEDPCFGLDNLNTQGQGNNNNRKTHFEIETDMDTTSTNTNNNAMEVNENPFNDEGTVLQSAHEQPQQEQQHGHTKG